MEPSQVLETARMKGSWHTVRSYCAKRDWGKVDGNISFKKQYTETIASNSSDLSRAKLQAREIIFTQSLVISVWLQVLQHWYLSEHKPCLWHEGLIFPNLSWGRKGNEGSSKMQVLPVFFTPSYPISFCQEWRRDVFQGRDRGETNRECISLSFHPSKYRKKWEQSMPRPTSLLGWWRERDYC